MNTASLNHDVVSGDPSPGRWLYVLHGIFGAGRNWATVARRVIAVRPDWGALLIDLREHGASKGFLPPHTIAAAAADLQRLGRSIDRPAAAVLGHSFGGKVALRFAADRPHGLRQVWVIDSTPDAGEPRGSAWQMLRVVRSLPDRFDSRKAGIGALTAGGVARPVAEWMATNLERDDEGLTWRFDTDSIEALMLDFFRQDLWPVVEHPPPGVTIHFVRASRSSVLSDAAIARIRSAAANGAVFLHTLEGGHWLNADNPDGLVRLMDEHLPHDAIGRPDGSATRATRSRHDSANTGRT